jgi:cell wall-associated NlpC family hydrolase
MAKFKFLLSVLFLMCTFLGTAQVITSKKQAVKKGIYKPRTQEQISEDKAVAQNTAEQTKVATPKPEVKTKPATASAKPKTTAKTQKKYVVNEEPDNDLIFPSFTNYLGTQMINNAMNFIGVKYRGGGTTTSGMDCSGMVTAVLDIFDIKMPRSSREMAQVGEKIPLEQVQTGDLIFFKTRGKNVINHVGMVVEIIGDEIKFIHSSTNKGVIISSTKEPYYKRSFAQVNRIPVKE